MPQGKSTPSAMSKMGEYEKYVLWKEAQYDAIYRLLKRGEKTPSAISIKITNKHTFAPILGNNNTTLETIHI